MSQPELNVSQCYTEDVWFTVRTYLCGGVIWHFFDKLSSLTPFNRLPMSHKTLLFVSKKTPKNAVMLQLDCTSLFTPKMKANAVPRLLSSLV